MKKKTTKKKAASATPQMATIIEAMFESPGFQRAWRELVDKTLVSEQGVQRMWELLKASTAHMEEMLGTTNSLTKAAADWACSIDWPAAINEVNGKSEGSKAFDAEAYEKFQVAVASTVTTLATVHLLRGVMIGVMTSVYCEEDKQALHP